MILTNVINTQSMQLQEEIIHRKIQTYLFGWWHMLHKGTSANNAPIPSVFHIKSKASTSKG